MERFSGAVKVPERVEIKGRESAEAWLKMQDHQTQVWFAARCALRQLPFLGTWQDATKSGLAFTTCRAALTSASAATCPAARMKCLASAAASASFVVRSIQLSADSAFPSAVSRVDAHSAATSAGHAAAFSADATRLAFSSLAAALGKENAHRAATFAAATFDANNPKNWGKLWPDGAQSETLNEAWAALKVQWAEDAADWSFWIRWYDSVLKGEWTNWDLIFRIATEVTEDQWEAGPAVVSARIAEIIDEQKSEGGAVTPEPVDPGKVVALFDKAPFVRASMASFSETVSLRVDTFARMQRTNEEIPFFDALKALPQTADRIAKILEEGRNAPDADHELALEIGRLRAEVEQLKAALKAAHAELETLRKKPWYKSASILLPVTVVSSIATGLWVLSGDDKSLEHRWNKLTEDLEFLSLKVWPEPDDRITEPLRFELPDAEQI